MKFTLDKLLIVIKYWVSEGKPISPLTRFTEESCLLLEEKGNEPVSAMLYKTNRN